jgi:hypothetical protein
MDSVLEGSTPSSGTSGKKSTISGSPASGLAAFFIKNCQRTCKRYRLKPYFVKENFYYNFMDPEKIEKQIIEKVLSSNEINLDSASNNELKNFIKEKVEQANYLNEEWQVHYAVESVFKEVKPHLKPHSGEKSKGRKLKFLIDFTVSIFFYSVLRILLNEVFPSLTIGGCGCVLILGLFYLLVTKTRSNTKGKEILYNILVAFIIFSFLAVNIGKFIEIDSAWPILPLFIVAYLLAKPVRIIFRKTLTYIGVILKKFSKKYE